MLDERKISILHAIINSYTINAEPVGSRTISKLYDLGVSSATIRNEMSDLEGLGYLNKAHSSSGRIPSDKAYRYYVNQLLSRYLENYNSYLLNFDEYFSDLNLEPEKIFSKSASILSDITKYTAMGVITHKSTLKIKMMRLLPVDAESMLLVLLYDTDHVSHQTIHLNQPYDKEFLERLNDVFARMIVMVDLNQALGILDKLLIELRAFSPILLKVQEILKKEIRNLEKVDVFYDGLSNIFEYPEYRDTERAKEFVAIMEEKDKIISLLTGSDGEGIHISIGEENKLEPLTELAVVSSFYNHGDGLKASVGIIGPKRMDYSSVIEAVISLTNAIKALIEYEG